MIRTLSVVNRNIAIGIVFFALAGTTIYQLGVFERLAVVARGKAPFQLHTFGKEGARYNISKRQYLEYQAALKNDKRDAVPDCKFPLGTTAEEDLAKIESYQFGDIQQYMEELFPSVSGEPTVPLLPVLVSAASSSHFLEMIGMCENLNETVFKKYTDIKLIIYDIGFDPDQVPEIKAACSGEVRTFPFEKYPQYVKDLQKKAWKPILIQLVAKEYPLLIWMDTSERFLTRELGVFFSEMKYRWLIVQGEARRSIGTISERTHNSTFNILHEHPCTFENQAEKHAGFIAVLANNFMNKYFLRPLVACALTLGCMKPVGSLITVSSKHSNGVQYKYHNIHRYEQSMIGILFTHLFHRNQEEHIVTNSLLAVRRGAPPNHWKSKVRKVTAKRN